MRDVDLVCADDRFLDTLAEHAGDPLAVLLLAWRADVDAEPIALFDPATVADRCA